jgi:hypothetical protein
MGSLLMHEFGRSGRRRSSRSLAQGMSRSGAALIGAYWNFVSGTQESAALTEFPMPLTATREYGIAPAMQ